MKVADKIIEKCSKHGTKSVGGLPYRKLPGERQRSDSWKNVGNEIRLYMANLAEVGIAADWCHIYRHGVHFINKQPTVLAEKVASKDKIVFRAPCV